VSTCGTCSKSNPPSPVSTGLGRFCGEACALDAFLTYKAYPKGVAS
jgi:hypothetical protein